MGNGLELEWHWQRSDGRYYRCSLQQNRVIIRQWGTLRSRHGRSMERLCRDYEDGTEEKPQLPDSEPSGDIEQSRVTISVADHQQQWPPALRIPASLFAAKSTKKHLVDAQRFEIAPRHHRVWRISFSSLLSFLELLERTQIRQ
ncbi:MAG: hypothetical protein AAGG53_03035 [Cyanobacteria bacterium P01_H01_bin.152]